MTIENSEDTAQVSVLDPAAEPVIEPASSSTEPVADGAAKADPTSSVKIEVARNLNTHDSAPPMSRKLAPPPKPKRDSGMASSMPPAQPGEPTSPDLLASSNALKAPIAPSISYSADDTAKIQVSAALPEPPAALPVLDPAPTPAPLSQPPPIRRRSNPAISVHDGEPGALGGARAPSDPGLTGGSSAAARPISAPPRPRSDPPPPRPRSDPSIAAEASPPAPAALPPVSSAIFAMRIIAVGDSARAKTSQDNAPDLDPDSYPPSASRLGTSVRRSSRPAATAAANVPVEVPAAARLPSALSASVPEVAPAPEATVPPAIVPPPFDVAPELNAGPEISIDVPIDEDIPIDVEPPITKAPSFPPVTGAPAFPPLSAVSSSSVPPPPVVQLRPPPPPPPVELGPVPAEEVRPPPPPPKVDLAAPPTEEVRPLPPPPKADLVPTDEVRPPPPPPKVDLGAVPPEELREVLAEVEASTEASEKPAETEEELGREDAISLPPEELAALKAEQDAKAEAVKPPPPPKRTTGALNVGAPAAAAEAPPKEPPPTPDPAAAKAAQRAKTRQPWWEDLFNEDFMRASVRVSDEQVRREVTFIEESLGVAAGGVVLDLGCGAGHHAVEFASRGYGVVGYDLSLYQLALAADVAQERSQKINFLQGDMREMAFEEMFDGVFCWNTTFGYFEEDKNLAVAQRVFKALRPGGMFLVDVLNRDFAAASAPCSVWYEGDSCVCMDDMSVDYISSRLRVKRSIILDDGRTKEALYSLRLYSLHELGKLLHEVGFRVTEASGHPATPGVFFGPNSPRIIMLAQRP